MSIFNEYAQKLDSAFKAARDDCNESAAKVTAAKEAVENFDKFKKERFHGENAAKLQALQQYLRDAENNHRIKLRDTWGEFSRPSDAIENELTAAIEWANTAVPEQVDSNTMSLLASEILSVAEVENLYNRFSGENNVTMQKLIGKYAKDHIGKTERITDRERLTAIHISSQNMGRDIMQNWYTLTDAASRFSGRSVAGAINYDRMIAARWEEAVGGIVENF